MTKRWKSLRIVVFILVVLMLCMGAYCTYGDSGDDQKRQPQASPNQSPPAASPHQSPPAASPHQSPNRTDLSFRYPTSDMTIEADLNDRVALSVEVQGAIANNSYQWQTKSGDDWVSVDGHYGNGYLYTTDPITEELDGSQYRCIATGYYGKTITSKVFTVVLREEGVSPGPSPSSSPVPRPKPTSHKHNWVTEYKTVPTYEETTIYGYACKGCDFKTEDLALMQQHDKANQSSAGHGGYQSNVQIDTKELPVYGYACRGCDFTSQDKAAMEEHVSDCPAHDVFSAWFCLDCYLGFATEEELKTHQAENPGGYDSIGTATVPDTTGTEPVPAAEAAPESGTAPEIAAEDPATNGEPLPLIPVGDALAATADASAPNADTDILPLAADPLASTPTGGESYYQCKNAYCGHTRFDTLEEMEQHLLSCPAHTLSSQGVFMCKTCFWAALTEDDANSHTSDFPDHSEFVPAVWICDVCGIGLADDAAKEAHAAQYPGSYDSNVQIGTQTTPIYGYACNGCDFTTRSLNAMEQHSAANQAQTGHGGYNSNVYLGTEQVQTGTKKEPTGKKICTSCNAKR